MKRLVWLCLIAAWAMGCGSSSDESDHDISDAAFEAGATWQWQLLGTIDTSFDVDLYDIDLFDAPAETIDALHEDGRAVVCYFSAGTYEDWRPDAALFTPATLGEALPEWEGERWLDVRAESVREAVRRRLDLAVEKGCDGVEPDNVDAYANDSGFPLTADDQLDFNLFIAGEARRRGLSVGLKNDIEQIPELEAAFDWALNESCMQYDECAAYGPFLEAGKAVFHVEYVEKEEDGPAFAEDVCDSPEREGLSTLVKTWELTAWRIACGD